MCNVTMLKMCLVFSYVTYTLSLCPVDIGKDRQHSFCIAAAAVDLPVDIMIMTHDTFFVGRIVEQCVLNDSRLS